MIYKELKYKADAINDLLQKTNRLLEKKTSQTIIFKAPTGAGKTIIMADYLFQLVNTRRDGKSFAFIWAAPRKLHLQSKEKLENFFKESRIFECSNIEDLTDRIIDENEILFVNWESINKKDAVFLRENETDFNLTSVINNTLEQGREIILVIDESHHTATAENTRGLIDIMKPRITIEVSATPHITSYDVVNVDFEDVVKEGMIKETITLNPDLPSNKLDGMGSDEFVLKEAIRKRNELQLKFEALGKDINPLLLIQLPDKKESEFEDKKSQIEDLLAKNFGITTANGKLAVYLSEDKRNLENIAKNNNEVEVLLFKQAIALGWDCPRAYILVLFREWHSERFSIQTVGRIMRMPEIMHYNVEALDKGYVYTNIANNNIIIEEEVARDYYTLYTSKRLERYKSIDLISFHTKRQRETTRLDPAFIGIFFDQAKKYSLKKKLKVKVSEVTDYIPIDAVIHAENIGTELDTIEFNENLSLIKTTAELEIAFKYFLRDALHTSGMFPERRSVGRVCTSIYHYFNEEMEINYEEEQRRIMTIVMSKENTQYIKDVIHESVRVYKDLKPKGKNQLLQNPELWNVPERVDFNANYSEKKLKFKKCIMSPFYEPIAEERLWHTETDFMDYLDKNESVDWWFKNGDRDSTFFAAPYIDGQGEDQPFYVDFIVKLNNGFIGLFDTKSGQTAALAGPKSDGLQKYIKEQNKKGKKLFGGIVHPDGDSFYTYTKVPYKYDKKLSDWELIDL